MNKCILMYVVCLFLVIESSYSQEIMRSGKTSFSIVIEQKDKIPPEINIISPKIASDGSFVSYTDRINIIGEVKDSSGIKTLLINSVPIKLTESGLFQAEIKLEGNMNEITVFAMDKKDNYSEKEITCKYINKGQSDQGVINVEGKYYGLLIGINKYADPSFPELTNPIKDAEIFYNVLSNSYNFSKENVRFLKNATRNEIIKALDDLAKIITPTDNLIIFYAGHGYWDESADVGYWMPADAEKDNKIAWFRNSTLRDYIKEIHSKHTLIITDACFAGSIFKTRSILLDAPMAISKLYELPSRKAMTSGTLTEVPDRSAFIKYLIDRLENNTEKYLSSEQLFSSFRIAVINNSNVVPQYGEIKEVGDEGGDFIFIRKD